MGMSLCLNIQQRMRFRFLGEGTCSRKLLIAPPKYLPRQVISISTPVNYPIWKFCWHLPCRPAWALIAYHPKRHVEASGPVSDKELKSARSCSALPERSCRSYSGQHRARFWSGRAGSFVRYRTTLRNPVDLSVILVLIGLAWHVGCSTMNLL